MILHILFILLSTSQNLFPELLERQCVNKAGPTDATLDDSKLFPVIGILAQEAGPRLPELTEYSYIAASYVKYIEAEGAVVVPIRMNQSDQYYEDMFNSVNGLLIPGGDANITDSHYAQVSRFFFEKAKTANDAGVYFPIFGICLGFEELLFLPIGVDKLRRCNGHDHASNIEFTDDANSSLIVQDMPDHVYKSLSDLKVTYNAHCFCLKTEDADDQKLRDFYYMPALGHDLNGTEFIAMIEAKAYPFFGTQWHPEKPIHEWKSQQIPHSIEAVESGKYFAYKFVQMARNCIHRFKTDESNTSLIFHHIPEFSADYSPFMQIYKFKDFNTAQSS